MNLNSIKKLKNRATQTENQSKKPRPNFKRRRSRPLLRWLQFQSHCFYCLRRSEQKKTKGSIQQRQKQRRREVRFGQSTHLRHCLRHQAPAPGRHWERQGEQEKQTRLEAGKARKRQADQQPRAFASSRPGKRLLLTSFCCS